MVHVRNFHVVFKKRKIALRDQFISLRLVLFFYFCLLFRYRFNDFHFLAVIIYTAQK